MNSIKEWFVELWEAYNAFEQELAVKVMEYLKTFFLWCFETGLNILAFAFELVAPPEFAAGGLQGLFNALPDSVIYFLGQSGLSEGLAILGGAYMFRLLRKLVTLGFW